MTTGCISNAAEQKLLTYLCAGTVQVSACVHGMTGWAAKTLHGEVQQAQSMGQNDADGVSTLMVKLSAMLA